jgi:hypothetical protein
MPFVHANAAPLVPGGPAIEHAINAGKLRIALAEFTFASDAIGTYAIPEMIFQPGQRIIELAANTSVSLGTAQFALGITGTVDKYRAAATLTATNQWTIFALNAAMGVRLTAREPLIMTTSVAALPASGRMLLRALFVDNT